MQRTYGEAAICEGTAAVEVTEKLRIPLADFITASLISLGLWSVIGWTLWTVVG